MDRSSQISLIKQTHAQDSIGQWIATETETTVFCSVKSVRQAEWAEAGRQGLNPSYVFTINRWEYSGEKTVKYNNIRYAVYRTYMDTSETIELHCEEKGGI